jgi:hypothetical protein
VVKVEVLAGGTEMVGTDWRGTLHHPTVRPARFTPTRTLSEPWHQ